MVWHQWITVEYFSYHSDCWWFSDKTPSVTILSASVFLYNTGKHLLVFHSYLQWYTVTTLKNHQPLIFNRSTLQLLVLCLTWKWKKNSILNNIFEFIHVNQYCLYQSNGKVYQTRIEKSTEQWWSSAYVIKWSRSFFKLKNIYKSVC